MDLRAVAVALSYVAKGVIITADNFVVGSLSDGGVIKNAVARHVYAHIGRRFIGTFAAYFLKHGRKHGENFDISVIVYGGYAVVFKVVRVNHVNVVKVGGCRFVGDVDGVAKRQIPYRKGFKLGISRFYSAHMVVINLAKAGGHFSATGTGSGNDYKGTRGFDIFVFAIAVFAYDICNIAGVAGDRIMTINLYAKGFKALFKHVGRRLVAKAVYNNASDIKAKASKSVDKAQNVNVVGYSQIAANLVFFDIGGVDGDNYFGLILKLDKHTNFTIGFKAGQYSCGMVIVKKLTAKLKIQLAAELRYAFTDMLRLHFYIFIVVKPLFKHIYTPKILFITKILLYTTFNIISRTSELFYFLIY